MRRAQLGVQLSSQVYQQTMQGVQQLMSNLYPTASGG